MRRLIKHYLVRRDSINRDKVLKLVVKFFGNAKKAELWMKSKNFLLGGVTPEFMVAAGRSGRLLKFVQSCIDENGR